MSKTLAVVSERTRKKVALFTDGVLDDLYIEDPGEAVVGNIYCGQITKVIPSIPGAFVDFGTERDGFLPLDGNPLYRVRRKWRKTEIDFLSRKEKAHEGQKVLVQVVKEPVGGKGCRLTTDVSLPGRYLVYMPVSSRGGISRQIADDQERGRLRNLLRQTTQGKYGAFIIRTIGHGRTRKDFERDTKALVKNWDRVCREYVQSDVPRLMHQELGLVERIIRDLFDEDFDEIAVNSRNTRKELLRILKEFSPGGKAAKKVVYRTGQQIESKYHVDRHIRQALSRRVWLKCGGYLFIDELPTLTAIDVNTGKNIRGKSPRQTIFETNIEAAREIPRQLRLRDIGGIIVIDFIDMTRANDREAVLEALNKAMELDKAAWDIIGFSEIGLCQITRKRDRKSLLDQLTDECQHCEGEGRVPKV
jgi:ribonuclease G